MNCIFMMFLPFNIIFTAAAKTKKIGKVGPIVEKIVLPVEKDTNKLVNYVCGSNINIEGEDIKVSKEMHA